MIPWDLGCCLSFHPRLRLGRKLNNNLGPKEIIYRPRVVLYIPGRDACGAGVQELARRRTAAGAPRAMTCWTRHCHHTMSSGVPRRVYLRAVLPSSRSLGARYPTCPSPSPPHPAPESDRPMRWRRRRVVTASGHDGWPGPCLSAGGYIDPVSVPAV